MKYSVNQLNFTRKIILSGKEISVKVKNIKINTDAFGL